MDDPLEMSGVNTPAQLAEVARLFELRRGPGGQ
jgi:hypothetical protein